MTRDEGDSENNNIKIFRFFFQTAVIAINLKEWSFSTVNWSQKQEQENSG